MRAPPVHGPPAAFGCIARRIVTLLVSLFDCRGQLVQPAASSAETAQALSLGLTLSTLPLAASCLAFFLLEQQPPPARERVTALRQDILNHLINVDTGGAHSLQDFLF